MNKPRHITFPLARYALSYAPDRLRPCTPRMQVNQQQRENAVTLSVVVLLLDGGRPNSAPGRDQPPAVVVEYARIDDVRAHRGATRVQPDGPEAPLQVSKYVEGFCVRARCLHTPSIYVVCAPRRVKRANAGLSFAKGVRACVREDGVARVSHTTHSADITIRSPWPGQWCSSTRSNMRPPSQTLGRKTDSLRLHGKYVAQLPCSVSLAQTHARARACTRTRTHVHHAHARTHAHTHTHTLSLSLRTWGE